MPKDQGLYSIEKLGASNDSGTLLEAWIQSTNNLIESTISFGESKVPLVCQGFRC